MNNTTKILVTTESREIYIVRMNGKKISPNLCPGCIAKIEMSFVEEQSSQVDEPRSGPESSSGVSDSYQAQSLNGKGPRTS